MNKFVPYEDRAASLTLRLAYLWLCALQLRDPHDPATQRDLDAKERDRAARVKAMREMAEASLAEKSESASPTGRERA